MIAAAKNGREKVMMDERDEAIALANKILDEPGRDPDDDMSMLSRQLLRALERNYRLLSAAKAVDLGRSIHNDRKPDQIIEGPIWVELREAIHALRSPVHD